MITGNKRTSYSFSWGFTLVELSIVLVIISLIITGVLVGNHLVRHTKVQNIIREVESFKAGVWIFENKFDVLAGDFEEAEAVWPECIPDPYCNGDGDGYIDNWPSREPYLVWKHLGLANILSTKYSGTYGVEPAQPDSGINSATGYYVQYYSGSGSSHQYGQAGHFFRLDSLTDYTNLVKALEAYHIDKKMDDGEGGTGNVLTQEGYLKPANSCVNSSGNYQFSDSIEHCWMYFKFRN